MPDDDVRLCIPVPRDTLADMSEGGVIDVPVTCLEIEDGVLVTSFRVLHADPVGTFGRSPSQAGGPLLRLYLQPAED